MYNYDFYDRALVQARVDQFRDQVSRRLSGALSEDEFLPLRLQNGVYLQRHAYMGYTDLMVDGAPSPHQSDTTLRWLIDRLRS